MQYKLASFIIILCFHTVLINAQTFNLSESDFNIKEFPRVEFKFWTRSIFDIDKNKLHANYIRLQQILHPDKQINKTKSEIFLAMEYTSKLNKAYQILNDDKKRKAFRIIFNAICS